MPSVTSSPPFESLPAQRVRGPGASGAAAARTTCLHCEQPLAGGDEAFCCAGCRTVHQLLRGRGLLRYYDLRGNPGLPVGELLSERLDRKWLEPIEAQLARTEQSRQLALDVQGIHCAACVWLLEELFRSREGALRIVVNPTLGRVELAVDPRFPLRAYLADVESFGYRFGPPLKTDARRSNELLIRAGICLALAGNAMLFAAAIYLGLEEGPLHTLLSQLGWAAALLAVLIGGPVFFGSAFQGLRRGLLHLDLPISLGILLAFGGSTWSFFFAGGRAAYVDTVAAFVALMLLGRFLQERMIEANRNQLLASDGANGLLARRVEDGRVELTPCPELACGDELIVAPGDLVPTAATLLDGPASFSLDWINGESEPRTFLSSATVPAGAFNAGMHAVRLRTNEPFEHSSLSSLLQRPRERDLQTERATPWWSRVSKGYVLLVLFAAGSGLAAWWIATSDLVRSIEVSTAVLVITCPCSFGIAAPLAYELAQAGLRRAGLFVRTEGFLDRIRSVRRIVFDKTGTLTTGALELDDAGALDALTASDRAALYDLAARSTHPKSAAVIRALATDRTRLRTDLQPVEIPGRGLEATIEGRVYRLGAPGWAAPGARGDLVFAMDGEILADLTTREILRPDARKEVHRLRNAGYELFILSGDSPTRVRAMADSLGIPTAHGVGGMNPTEKADWLATHHGGEALFVGDGINDGPAADRALCSGTPAVDRPFMAARCDFFFVTPGLAPIAQALRTSVVLAHTVRRSLVFATAYNIVAVGLAWAGFMQPWLAAILMPASSLTSLAMTGAALSSRSRTWKF